MTTAGGRDVVSVVYKVLVMYKAGEEVDEIVVR